MDTKTLLGYYHTNHGIINLQMDTERVLFTNRPIALRKELRVLQSWHPPIFVNQSAALQPNQLRGPHSDLRRIRSKEAAVN